MFSFNLSDLPPALRAQALRLVGGLLTELAGLVEQADDGEDTPSPFALTPPVMPPGAQPLAAAGLPTTAPGVSAGSEASPPNASPAPVAPPTATAPAATVAPTAAGVAGQPHAPGVELDSRGFPWDGRIHSESKGKIGDGSWRKKKNLDPAVLAAVEAEYIAARNAGTPAAVPATPAPAAGPTAAPPAPPAPPAAPAAAVPPAPPAAPPAPPAPVAPVAAATPAPAPAAEAKPADFGSLMVYNGARINAGKLTAEEVTGIALGLGLPNVGMIATRPDLIPSIVAQVDAIVAARGGL